MEIDRPTAIAITLFVILLLMFFLVVPKYKEFKNLQMQVGRQEAEYNAKFEYYSEIGRIFRELENYQDILVKIDIALPENSYYGPLIYLFNEKAGENGLILKDVFLQKSSPLNQSSDIKEIVFSLDVLGNYSAVKNFIASLEKSSRLFEITANSFSSLTPSDSKIPIAFEQTYTFALEVKTYSY